MLFWGYQTRRKEEIQVGEKYYEEKKQGNATGIVLELSLLDRPKQISALLLALALNQQVN